MKKILLLFAVFIMTTNNLIAQNANRSGVFVELQGGAAIGDVLQYRIGTNPIDDVLYYKLGYFFYSTYLKGGVTTSLDFGYRWTTSNHLSLDAKIGVNANLAEFKYTYAIRLMPGIRWTSNDFWGSTSLFLSLNAGVGVTPTHHIRLSIPIELSAGLNFTSHIYGGIYANFHCFAKEYEVASYGDIAFKNPLVIYEDIGKDYIKRSLYVCTKDHLSCGVRLGYRF